MAKTEKIEVRITAETMAELQALENSAGLKAEQVMALALANAAADAYMYERDDAQAMRELGIDSSVPTNMETAADMLAPNNQVERPL